MSTLRRKKEFTRWDRFRSSAGNTALCFIFDKHNSFKCALEWWWKLRISPIMKKTFAILFAIVSICIIFSELVFNVRQPVIISIVYYASNACGSNYAALEVTLNSKEETIHQLKNLDHGLFDIDVHGGLRILCLI